jgi:hypothetical protein
MADALSPQQVAEIAAQPETRLQRALRKAKEARNCWGWDSRMREVVRAVRAEEREKHRKREARRG